MSHPFRTALLSVLAATALPLRGQIATDGSLGRALALDGSVVQIPESLGRSVGANLFHSFREFSIQPGHTASFTGSPDTARVVARVTGGNLSRIDGTLKSDIPGADFFLINPAGVTFGADAKVDVNGSFTAVAADYLKMADGTKFNARAGGDDVLTVAPPSAFGFLGPAVGDTGKIGFQGDGFGHSPRSDRMVSPGTDLTIVGHGIRIEGAAQVVVPEGALRMAAVDSAGELPVDTLDTKGFSHLGDVTITEDSHIDVGGGGRGELQIRGHDLSLGAAEDEFPPPAISIRNSNPGDAPVSTIALSGQLATEGRAIEVESSGESTGGGLRIRAAEVDILGGGIFSTTLGESKGPPLDIQAHRLSIRGEGSISTTTNEIGAGGDIQILATDLEATDGASVTTASYDEEHSGNSGGIDILASRVRFEAGATLDSSAAGRASAGSIHVRAASLELSDGRIDSGSYGSGRGGDVQIEADKVTLGGVYLGSQITSGATGIEAEPISGAGGNLRITAGTVELLHGASLSTGSVYAGDSGALDIHADLLRIEDSSSIDSANLGSGQGGRIEIRAVRLELLDGTIDSGSYGSGNGGDILIHTDRVTIGDPTRSGYAEISSGPSARDGEPASGSGGKIRIETGDLEMLKGSQVTAASVDAGKSGDVEVVARNIRLGDFASIESAAYGLADAGNIVVEAESLELAGGSISSITFGGGKGGDIFVQVGRLLIDGATGQGEISSGPLLRRDSPERGTGGDIRIEAREVQLRHLASISAASINGGNSGDVTICARNVGLEDVSSVSAEAVGEGNAGTIAITTDHFALDGSDVRSSSRGGAAGGVRIQARTIRLSGFGTIDSASDLADAGSVELSGVDGFDGHEMRLSVTSKQANAGRLVLQSDGMVRLEQVELSASAGSTGGNIRIEGAAVGLKDTELKASAERGNGGDITIVTDLYYALGVNTIEYESQNQSARSGSFTIQSTLDLVGSLETLRGEIPTDAIQVREGCARRNPRANSLLVRSKGGVPGASGTFVPTVSFWRP